MDKRRYYKQIRYKVVYPALTASDRDKIGYFEMPWEPVTYKRIKNILYVDNKDFLNDR